MTPLSDAEVARRMPLWCVLSDLFLDTAMPEHWIPAIASVIVRDSWSLEEAENILRWEVRPAFYFNLLDIAGEWAFWDEDEVRQRVLTTRAPSRMKRLLLGQNRFMPGKYWHAVVDEVERRRAGQPAPD